MKKFILFLILSLLYRPAYADDAADWQKIYSEIKSVYINEINISQLATAALKGLNSLDSHLRLADDNTRITLYYQGKVVKVLTKPKDNNDAVNWGKITAQIISAAENASPKADEQSFRISDELAKGVLSVLDEDSEFYANMDEAGGTAKRNKRRWSARLLDDGVLYIKITAFNKQTYSETLHALQTYPDAEKLTIDVRGCLGGMAGEAIKTADLFLDEGIIASTFGKNKLDQTYYNADEQQYFKDKPIELWTDNKTASAAEILVAALQEQSRATVKGQKTFGKGTMQKLILLPSGSVLAVTNGYFQTPSGKKLHKNGVTPNIEEENLPEF